MLRRVAMTWGPAPTRKLVAVFVEGDVTYPVQGVLDGPVSLDPCGDDAGLSVFHRNRADRVHDLNVSAPVAGSGPADLQDLLRAGPVHPRRDLHGLDRSSHAAAVAGVEVGVPKPNNNNNNN